MEKDTLFHRVQTMIISSTKKPKYISLSTVKIADLFHVNTGEVERTLLELVNEGRLQKKNLSEPPHYEIYLLP
ncbi:PCI domain-containing protein [Peribacillus butanolivorans]|uniref:PCI domain-containing protein n=1 Tax=Peribacillus butanolivorans TaxID=421767 RepID=UPI0039FDBFE8